MTDRKGRNNGYPTRRRTDFRPGGGSFRPPRRAALPTRRYEPVTLPRLPSPTELLNLLVHGDREQPWWQREGPTRPRRRGGFGGGGASGRWDAPRRAHQRDYADLVEPPTGPAGAYNFPCLPTPFFKVLDQGEGWNICGPHGFSLPACPINGIAAIAFGSGITTPGACTTGVSLRQTPKEYKAIGASDSFYFFMNYDRCRDGFVRAAVFGGGSKRATGPYRDPIFGRQFINCVQPAAPVAGPGNRPNPWPEGRDSREPSQEDKSEREWDIPPVFPPPLVPPPPIFPVPPVAFVMPPVGPGIPRPNPPRREPPKRGTRERKARIPAGAWRLLRVMGDISEAADLVSVLYKALPASARLECRRRGLSGTTRVEDALRCVFTHADEVDIEEAVRGYIKNQIEDAIYAAPGRLAGQASRRLREAIGSDNPTGVSFGEGQRRYWERGVQQESGVESDAFTVSDFVDMVADPVLDEIATVIRRLRAEEKEG